jgi:tRNA dimethylallyltransferase
MMSLNSAILDQLALTRKPVIIVGPTASGKTALSLNLAEELTRRGDAREIVGCDSVQIYQGFDIGSAKPTADERARVKHHLIDLVTWRDNFDADMFARAGLEAITALTSQNKRPIVVGGSGLYLRSLRQETWHSDLPKDEKLRSELQQCSTEDLWQRLTNADPTRAAQLHKNDRFRVIRALEIFTLSGRSMTELGSPQTSSSQNPLHDAFVIALDPPRATLHERIARRTRIILQDGLLEETRRLLAEGCPAKAKPMQSIGYKEACLHLGGQLPASALESAILASTRQYAKRQCTWWKKVARDLTL